MCKLYLGKFKKNAINYALTLFNIILFLTA